MKLSRVLCLLLLTIFVIVQTASADRRRLNRFSDLVVTSVDSSGTTLPLKVGGTTIGTLSSLGYSAGFSGSAAQPYYHWAADLDLGWFRSAANAMSASAGGTTVATFDSGGLVMADDTFVDLSQKVYTATGGTQGTAVDITTSTALVAGATGTEGAELPPAESGRVIFLYNSGGGVLKLYPAAGDSINAGAANAAANIASNAFVVCFSRLTGNNNWRCGESPAA